MLILKCHECTMLFALLPFFPLRVKQSVHPVSLCESEMDLRHTADDFSSFSPSSLSTLSL